jgi:hypothetical protein
MNAPVNVELAVTELRVRTTAALDERILNDAWATLQGAVSRPVERTVLSRFSGRRWMLVAAAVLLAATFITVMLLSRPRGAAERRPVAHDSQTPAVPVAPLEKRLPATLPVDGRERIERMYADHDVEGLIRILDEGGFGGRILAAKYLGEIGDERAVAALAQLAGGWQGDPDENPFARAVDQIRSRVPPTEPNTGNVPSRSVLPAEVTPEPAPLLSGTITDAQTGRPIPGVTIRISPRGGGRAHDATSAEDGVYRFKTVGADGTYLIMFTAPDHITPEEWSMPREMVELRADGHVVKDYVLERGCKVILTLVDEQGRPVQQANVYAAYVSDEIGRGPKRPVRSDAAGRVSLGGLPQDEYLLTAAHPDYALAGQRITFEEPKQTKSVTFVLQRGIDVAGVAMCSDGLPAAGWVIQPQPQWWRSLFSWPRGDSIAEDGTFVLKHIVPGMHRLNIRISVVGGSRGIWSTDVNLPPEGGVLQLEIPKPSPFGRVSISGTVRFPGGENTDVVWIMARDNTGQSGGTFLDRWVRDFVLSDLTPGLYDIDVIAGSRWHTFKNIRAPSQRVVLEVPVQPVVRLSARVVDKTSRKPVTDFRFSLTNEPGWRQVRDPNGRFEIESRGQERPRVTVQADGYDETMAELRTDAQELTVIELGVPGVLAGVVVDPAGRPVEGASINYRYRRAAQEPPDGKFITNTDADGRFRVDDVPADTSGHWFVIRHPEYARCLTYVPMKQHEVTEARIVLHEGGAIEGYVHDWQGKPLRDTTIYVMDESHFPYWDENRARLGSAQTDADGFYRIDHMPEELCHVFCGAVYKQHGTSHASILPKRGRTSRLDLGGLWKASGRLLKDGAPVAHTRMMVDYQAGFSGGFETHTITDAQGAFTFWGVPTGLRRVYWGGEGSYSWARGWKALGSFDFRRGVDLDLGDFEVTAADVTVKLVREDESVPADRWSVTLQEYSDQSFWGRSVGPPAVRTGDADPFVFPGVSTGVYEAVAQREDYPPIRALFEVTAGQRTHHVVLSIPLGSASISGQMESGSSLPLPTLMLRRTDERVVVPVQPGVKGQFEVGNLPPGSYAVGLASAAAGRTSVLAQVTLDAREHKTVRVPVQTPQDPQGYLAVLLVTQAGLPLATPHVWLERSGQAIKPHFNSDIATSFAGEPGTYTLHAIHPGCQAVQTTVEMKSKQDQTIQEVLQPVVIIMTER